MAPPLSSATGRSLLSAALLVFAVLSGPERADAATFCANSVSSLRAALNTAASNGESDTIRIRIGTYPAITGGVGFDYFSSENFSLTLDGGWSGVTPTSCSIRFDDSEATVLDGVDQRSVLRLLGGVNSGASFVVRNLTIRNARGTTAGGTGFGGLEIGGLPLLGDITVDRVILRDNHSDTLGGGLRVQTLGMLRVINSLFDRNSCDAYYCAADVFASAPSASAAQPRLLFLGNTVVRTACSGTNCGLGQVNIQPGTDFPTQFVVGNSVFALNAGVDVSFAAATGILRNSRWDSRLGTPQSMLSNFTPGTSPGFAEPAIGDFRLQPGSPLIDAGFAFIDLPAFDLDGAARQSGAAPDIGAYEYVPDPGLVFRNGFEQP
jgi:hypothetical protein